MSTEPQEIRIAADVEQLAAVRQFVRENAQVLGASQLDQDQLIQAVDELVANTIDHGLEGCDSCDGEVSVALWAEGEEMVVRLVDNAPPFDPTQVPPPDLSRPLEVRISGGLGIFLARRFTDCMTYRLTADGKNELTLRKRISPAAED